MRDGRMTILDVIPTAKGMGYEGVEIVKFCSDEEMREYAPKSAAQSKEFEMPSSLTWSARISWRTA